MGIVSSLWRSERGTVRVLTAAQAVANCRQWYCWAGGDEPVPGGVVQGGGGGDGGWVVQGGGGGDGAGHCMGRSGVVELEMEQL